MKPRIDAGVKIKISREPPKDTDELLDRIFWKDPGLAPIAREFLNHVREWGMTGTPYRVDEWDSYCTRKGLTQSRYHNILKRLRKAGLVDKTYNKNRGKHELHLTDKFSESLSRMAGLWDDYRKS